MEKPNIMVRFFSVLLKIVVVLVLMVVIAIASFEGVSYYLTGSFYDLRELAGRSSDITNMVKEEQEPEIDETNMRSTLFFVDSVDSGKEYIALNMLNTRTHMLDILLIPTNAQVTVGQDLLDDIQKELPGAKNSVNLGDIARAFGEDKYAMISDILESVTGLTLSGYDVMTQKNFESFLSMADMVSYQVENDMSYRDEDGVLHVIDGEQTEIDSTEAIALLTYMDGTDTEESARLERTNVYLQNFFTALFEKNDSDVIYRKYTSLIETGDGRDLSDEEEIFAALDPAAITIRIMQGSESDDVFTVDSQMVQIQIATLAQQTENVSSDGQSANGSTTDSGSSTETDSKEYSIELYNSAYVAGLAAEWEAYLEEEGYSISLVDSYQEEGPLSTTRIVVTEDGMGEDLLHYFPNATIEVDDIDTGGDIQVFIGTDSTDVGEGSSSYGMDSSSYEDEEDGEDGDSSDEEETTSESSGYGGSYNFDTDSAE